MSYKLKSIKTVKKDLKILHPKLIEEIKNRHFKKIKESPFEAYELGYSFEMLSESDKEALDFVIEKFGRMKQWELRDYTHKYPE